MSYNFFIFKLNRIYLYIYRNACFFYVYAKNILLIMIFIIFEFDNKYISIHELLTILCNHFKYYYFL